ncbi:MAG: leucine-rich repeat protein [Oscillospiraceae bacterium]|nr:leucine-rich repeat protein [Oscillospiraceae bacterium]
MNHKRLIGALMAAGMAVSSVFQPLAPIAEKISFSLPGILASAAEIVASGECGMQGDNLTWTLDSAGVLNISGEGAMADWDYPDYSPWYNAGHSIDKVELPDGLTYIGNNAFFMCSNLTDIIIPDSVTAIGQFALSYCSISSITISQNVTLIMHGALWGSWNLERIIVDPNNTEYSSMDGILYDKNQNKIIFYPPNKPDSTFVVPDSVQTIAEGAFFANGKLTSVTMDSVSEIENWAFHLSRHLKDITILNPDCEIYDDKSVIPETITIYGYAGSTAQAYAEKYSRQFEPLDNSEEIKMVEDGICGSQEDNLFWQYYSDGTLNISGSGDMQNWSSSSYVPWEKYGEQIQHVSLPADLTSIGKNAFSMCSNLTDIIIPDGVTIIHEYAFRGCTQLTGVQLPVTLTDIYMGAFQECENLETIELPEGVSYIDSYAFKSCHHLKNVTIPSQTTHLGCGVFAYCEDLQSINVASQNAQYASCDGVLYRITEDKYEKLVQYPSGKTASMYQIRDCTKYIEWYAFAGCSQLRSVSIPDTVISLGDAAFEDCSSIRAITLPSSVTAIDAFAFRDCVQLEDITILNPECQINDYEYTIYNKASIHGYKGSTAEAYAKKYSRTFIALDAVTTTATTTTTSTTTTTRTTTTTTTTATTTTTTTTADRPYQMEYDAWNFINNKRVLGIAAVDPKDNHTKMYHYLTDADREKLLKGLSETETDRINNVLNTSAGGFCYGMSATSILNYAGILNLTEILPGIMNPHQVKDSILENTEQSRLLRSAINYYQLLQYTDVIQQEIRAYQYQTESTKFKELLETLESGKPTLICYSFKATNNPLDNTRQGHAVVAYAIETLTGSQIVEFAGIKFDKHISIYNNNYLTADACRDMYLSTETEYWYIPMTNDADELDQLAIMNNTQYRDGILHYALSDTDILNSHGLYHVNPDYKYDKVQQCHAGMDVTPFNGIQISPVKTSSNGAFNASDDDGDILFSANYFGDENDTRLHATMDSTLCYYVESKSGEKGLFDFVMEYEHCNLYALADSGKRITVSPDACIECTETSGKYALTMVQDQGTHATDWHKIAVAGTDGGTVMLQSDLKNNGWVMTGDSLKNVTVTANNYKAAAEKTFSAGCKKVLIYEIDENTIGIKADTDGDGIYETELTEEEQTELAMGDLTGDGIIGADDAQAVLQAYVNLISDLGDGLTDAQRKAADINKDGAVSGDDAQLILQYYVNTLSDKEVTWEELIK